MLQKFRQTHSGRTLARPFDCDQCVSSYPEPSGKVLDSSGKLIAAQIILIVLAH
jgi:hypothetical protein